MKSSDKSPKRHNGFLLMEVVIALGIFAIACTALVVAFNRMANTASLAQNELKITRILESALAEELSYPTLEEGTVQIPVEGTNIELDVEITPIDDLENKDGQLLQEMYRIVITANWFAEGKSQSRSVETWRYNLMYQP